MIELISRLVHAVEHWFPASTHNHHQLMAELQTLNSNIVALTASVDAVLTHITNNSTAVPAADVQAAADAVAVQTGRLTSAITPPVVAV